MGEGCALDCELPNQYGRLCKCWLFTCMRLDIPVPILLLHTRWFFDGPAKVYGSFQW